MPRAGKGEYKLILSGQCPDDQVELDESVLSEEGPKFALGSGVDDSYEPSEDERLGGLYEKRRRLDREDEQVFDERAGYSSE